MISPPQKKQKLDDQSSEVISNGHGSNGHGSNATEAMPNPFFGTSAGSNKEETNSEKCDKKLNTEAGNGRVEEKGTHFSEVQHTPHQCSICLEDAQLAVETNCGHVFCSNCLLEVWRRSSQLSAISCPYCRQRVTLMLPYFTQEENNAVDPVLTDYRVRLVAEMTVYNRRNSGEPRSVMEQLRDLPMLLRHLLTRLITGEGILLAFRVRIMVLGAVWVLYLLSPLDLIPEAMFGVLGLLDDLFLFILLASHLTFIFRTLVTHDIGGVGLQ